MVAVRKKATGVVLTLLTAASLPIPLADLLAQDVGDARLAQAQPADTRRFSFDIPAKPLGEAITDVGATTGWRIVFTETAPYAITTRPLVGSFTAEEALGRLLASTGLVVRITGQRAASIERPGGGDGSSLTLGPIQVEAQGESAWGPVSGYAATRSATGTKTDTPLIEAPRSISVVPAEQIKEQRPRTVAESLNYVPGVMSAISGYQPTASNITVRGFDQFSASQFQDGLRLSTSSYSGTLSRELYGMERVELLRGPASILYGQISPGGLLNTVSKRPLETPHREVELQGGTFERKQIAFDMGGPIGDDGKYLYRLIGVGRDSDTQVDFIEDDRAFFAGGLTWKPTGATTVTFLADHQADNSAFSRSFPASGTVLANPNGTIPSDRFVGEPGFDDEDVERTSIGYLAEHHIGTSWVLRQNLRYSRDSDDLQSLFPAGFQADQRTLNRNIFVLAIETDSVVVDTHAQAKFATGPVAHTAIAGIDYQWLDLHRKSSFVGGPSIDIFAPVYGQTVVHPGFSARVDQTFDQVGFYGQDQLKIYDKVVLQLGGRYDTVESRTDDLVANTTTRTRDSAFTGQAGVVYLFDNGIAPYASYAESFEPQAGTSFGGTAFEPTTGTQYEVGLKYQPPGYNSLVTFSVFEITRQNVTTPDPANPGFNVQTGEVRSRGFELEGRASLAMGLDLIATYTLLDAEVTRSNGTDLGKTPARVPDHMASLWASYRVGGGGLKGLKLGGGVRYVGESYGDGANTFKVESYVVADASVSYELGNWRLAVSGTNILDNEYIAACFSAASGCHFGSRRTVIGSVAYRW